jgi:NIPSNAP
MCGMKTTLLIALGIASVLAATHLHDAAALRAADTTGQVYELRTYHTPPGKLDALHARFRDHSIALLQRHGMKVVGFWVPTDASQGSADTLVYILAHKSRAAADASWAAFSADPEWVRVKAESEKNGPLTSKVDKVFMSATDYSPLK